MLVYLKNIEILESHRSHSMWFEKQIIGSLVYGLSKNMIKFYLQIPEQWLLKNNNLSLQKNNYS